MKDEEFGIIDWKLTTQDGEIIAGGKGGRVGVDLPTPMPPPSPIMQIIKANYRMIDDKPFCEVFALCENGSIWNCVINWSGKVHWSELSPPQESATWTGSEQAATGGVSWLDVAGPVILGILMIVLSCIGVITVINWVTGWGLL